jgi:dipeptidase E
MVCFLTSSPVIPGTLELNPANSFMDELHRRFQSGGRVLFICSNPDVYDKTDFFANEMKGIFENSGFPFGSFTILDSRNEHDAPELINNSDLIILAGGHVPTQNRFFRKIGLKALLKDYDGVLIGISAGSMNSAETVYAQPEEEGEAIDPEYQRFLPGLGLTNTMLIPHYQEIKDDMLDGLRLFADVTFPDSMGRTFYAIPDGSYLFIGPGGEELRGEACRIRDGVISRVSVDGGAVSPDRIG